MNARLKTALAVASLAIATQAAAAVNITFYEHPGFAGRSLAVQRTVFSLSNVGFNDRASSAVVTSGRWLVCEEERFEGNCVLLRPGQYPSLGSMGLNNRVSSVRDVHLNSRYNNVRPAPAAFPIYDARPRPNEQLFEAPVTYVRAVVGRPEQRCWVERQQVVEDHGGPNVPGAIAGAVIGGVLGHQVGGGRGKDVATAGGAVVGAAVGANVGRGGQDVSTRNVRRCDTVPSQARPEYWDVGYNFRDVEHRVQLTRPPGKYVTVNGRGEPRE